MRFNSVLVAKPTFFEVAYAINPYMTDASGQLNKVDQKKAQAEWQVLVSTFKETGLKVFEMDGVRGLPDIVFTANQSFPFWNTLTQRYEIILSKMRSPERAPEVPYFEKKWTDLGFTVHHLNYPGAFEGNGDAIYSPDHGVVFGGYGPRTDKEVYTELVQRFGLKVVPLELRLKDFYHLDTCFSILSKEVAAIQPDAFSKEGLQLLRSYFSTLVEIPLEENRRYFCGNCFCPDGKNVIVQKGSPSFAEQLKRLDFRVWEIDTTEFMKSGGSVFCLKLFFPG